VFIFIVCESVHLFLKSCQNSFILGFKNSVQYLLIGWLTVQCRLTQLGGDGFVQSSQPP